MKKIIIAILACLLAAGLGYAEQNKDAEKKGRGKRDEASVVGHRRAE